MISCLVGSAPLLAALNDASHCLSCDLSVAWSIREFGARAGAEGGERVEVAEGGDRIDRQVAGCENGCSDVDSRLESGSCVRLVPALAARPTQLARPSLAFAACVPASAVHGITNAGWDYSETTTKKAAGDIELRKKQTPMAGRGNTGVYAQPPGLCAGTNATNRHDMPPPPLNTPPATVGIHVTRLPPRSTHCSAG